MALKFKKTLVWYKTNSGIKELSGYGAGGLVAAKLYDKWNVFHADSGMIISDKLASATKRGATAKIEKLLALPINWEMDEKKIYHHLNAAKDDILRIAGE